MKFTRLQLRGLYDVWLPVVGALPTDKFILKGSDGLGPTEVDVSIARPFRGNGVYQGRQPQSREITLRIGLNPDWSTDETVEELREEIYGLLAPPRHSDFVTFSFFDDRLIFPYTIRAKTRCWVKRCEIVPFAEEPEVQVVLSCLDSYFEAPELIYHVPPGPRAGLVIDNAGTAPSGMLINVTFTGAASFFRLVDSVGNVLLHVTHNFEFNDLLRIDSRPGHQEIWVLDLETTIQRNLAAALSPESDWIMLTGGENRLDGSSSNLNWEWGAIQYLPLFLGV